MSNAPGRTLEEILEGLRACAAAAISIVEVRPLYSDPQNPYTPCVNGALSFVLHLMADISVQGSLQVGVEQPFDDFGVEPLGVKDAEAYLPDFLRRVQSTFGEMRNAYPFCRAEIRATTFALLLDPAYSP